MDPRSRRSDLSRLVHGDNAEVLARLRKTHAGKVKCAYLDPPFNTGRSFAEYTDRAEPGEWARLMGRVGEDVRALLSPDGAMWVEIDDTEVGALVVTLDAVFGRDNRMAIITVVRSAATGHKAINRGPVNVTDYLLLYAKDRARFRPRPLERVREGCDPAYRLYIEHPSAPDAQWTFEPLAKVVAARLGFSTALAARRALGDAFARELDRFALANASHVVRFAQPRYEAIGKAARALVDRSKRAPAKVFRLARNSHPDFIVRGGNRLLFLADKVRMIDGAPRIVEPLTNVWDDIGFQGIAKEGGVVFSRNKKPERLLARILEMTTEAGDWVLDPFVGSGTTAAVAHKMGRRFLAIERERDVFERARARLDRVVRGEDPTGITKSVGWCGGGELRVE